MNGRHDPMSQPPDEWLDYLADLPGRSTVWSPDPSPRSWSLPAPPPDDVTVVHLRGDGMRCERKGEYWVNPYGGELTWGELFSDGFTVVEGEPTAPEPQVAAPPASRHTNNPCELHPVAVRGTPSTARLEPAPEPRFERGFYRLERDLDTEHGTIRAGLVFVSEPDSVGEQWVGSEDVNGWVTAAALAAAGAERVEEGR